MAVVRGVEVKVGVSQREGEETSRVGRAREGERAARLQKRGELEGMVREENRREGEVKSKEGRCRGRVCERHRHFRRRPHRYRQTT